jgi:streptogramin lyase
MRDACGGRAGRCALGAALSALLLTGCGGDGSDDQSATTSTTIPAPAPVRTIDLDKAGAKKINQNGDRLAAGAGAIWLSDARTYHRIDPASGRVTNTLEVPGGPCLGSAFAFGALWTATCVEGGLSRIDPKSLKVTDHILLPIPTLYDQEETIAAGEGAVWLVVDGQVCEACVLVGIDPQTLKPAHEIDLDPGAASVAVGHGFVWVTDPKRNRVLKVDPATDEIVATTDTGGLPQYVAVDDNGVWTIDQLEGTVTEIDPETATVTTTIPANVAGAGGSITTGDGSVWVRGTLKLLTQIDSDTGQIVARYGPNAGSGDALVSDGVLWVSAFGAPEHVVNTQSSSGSSSTPTVWRLPLGQ